jgi:hypothetical protein
MNKSGENSPRNGFLCPYFGNCYSFLVGGNRSLLGLSHKVKNPPTRGHPEAVWWPLGVFEPKVDSKNAGQKKRKPRPSEQKGGAFYSKTSGIGQLKREHSFKFIDSKGHRNRPTAQRGTENTNVPEQRL